MRRVFRNIDRQNRKDNISALEILRKQDIQFVKASNESLEEWYTKASTVSDRLITTGRLSRDIVDTLEKHLKEYRSKNRN